ncbi:MAG TPA: anthranilate phosphoribosyltransferase [bacterium]|nr:anthranilate phosphoribosyltransferase [bacterium]
MESLIPFLKKVVSNQSLSAQESHEAMTIIMDGEATPAQIAGYLVSLRMKGETPEEIVGAARAMREHATPVDVGDLFVVDTCGTGGDAKGTINVSTLAAFIAAGAGVSIAKHGNRAASSRCGSADLLAGLGVNLDLAPEQVAECIKTIGIGFLFAPKLHQAMKHAIGPRREMGIRTIFNVLGPLTNPANAKAQLMGVFDETLVEPLAEVLCLLGSEHAMVVHGYGGYDEISSTGPTKIAEAKNGSIHLWTLDPKDLGVPYANSRDLLGGDVNQNIAITRRILDNELSPCLDLVVLNAAAAIVVGKKAEDMREGIEVARKSVASGSAREKLQQLITRSNAS